MAGDVVTVDDGATLAAALADAYAWVAAVVVGSLPEPTGPDLVERFAPRFLDQVPAGALVTVLARIRSEAIANESTASEPVDSGATANFTIGDRYDVSLTIGAASPHQIVGLLFSPCAAAREALAATSLAAATWVTDVLTGAAPLPTIADVEPRLNAPMLKHAQVLVDAFGSACARTVSGAAVRLEAEGPKTSFVVGEGQAATVGWVSVDASPPHAIGGVQFIPMPEGAGPITPPAKARRHRQSASSATVDSALDEIVTQLADETKAPGPVLVVSRGDELVHVDGRGEAWLGAPNPPDEHTPFRVGSVTKIVTALAVLRQVRSGRMDLDAAITDYVSGVEIRPVEGATSPTLRHLLTQTSGLQRDIAGVRRATVDFRTLVAGGLDAVAAPGTVEAYSNVGFGLLGLALEDVTGHSYAELVADELPGATADADPPASPPAATGYEVGAGIARPAGLQQVPELGAGGVVATPEQLLVLGRRMYEDPDLGRRQDLPTRHALAAVRLRIAGREALFHNGGLSGWKSSLYVLPAEQLVVAVTVNVLASSVDDFTRRVVQVVVNDLGPLN